MAMSIPELERALRALRLFGMTATLQVRALQVAHWPKLLGDVVVVTPLLDRVCTGGIC